MSELGIGSVGNLGSLMLSGKIADAKAQPPVNPAGGQAKSFQETLKSALQEVNESIHGADKAAQNFASGKAESLHDVMIAMEKAELQLRTLTSVRGKMVEAYQEIMRMPV